MRQHDEPEHDPALRHAHSAARALGQSRQREPEAPAPEEREAAIAALASAIATRPGRIVRRRVILAMSAAAVAVFALGLVQLGRGSGVTARVDGGPFLTVGTVVRADSERPVSLTLSTGTRLQLSERGRLRLLELGARQQFELAAGRLSARVSPLARGQRFLIETPDAEIEVRGTAFEVALAPERPPCGGGITQVKVSEGLVTVRRGDQVWQVPAGRRWPDACPPAAPVSTAPSATAAPGIDDFLTKSPSNSKAAASVKAGSSPSPARALVARGRHGDRATMSSNLREQNELFATAMDARRRGDVAAARRALDDLLARFPFGALAESARAELAAVRGPSGGISDAPP